jgi:hypothetical protein
MAWNYGDFAVKIYTSVVYTDKPADLFFTAYFSLT